MNLEVWCQTDVGMKRERNEDSFLIDRELGIFIVADGMGGHRGGDLASKMAVQKLRDVVSRHHSDLSEGLRPHDLLRKAYAEASRSIYHKSHIDSPELEGMGTTLVCTFFYDGVFYIGNVGDSRAYLYSSPHLWQITEDHSLMNEQIRLGLLKEENAHNFVAKNVITRSVGFEPDVECDVIERKAQSGDLIIMCSDGLTGHVSDPMLNKMCQDLKPAEIVPNCIEKAKQLGGDDNITVMVLYAKP